MIHKVANVISDAICVVACVIIFVLALAIHGVLTLTSK